MCKYNSYYGKGELISLNIKYISEIRLDSL